MYRNLAKFPKFWSKYYYWKSQKKLDLSTFHFEYSFLTTYSLEKKVDKKKWKSRGWSHMQEMKGVRQMVEDWQRQLTNLPLLFFWICPCVYTFIPHSLRVPYVSYLWSLQLCVLGKIFAQVMLKL
jgi:hypothetical protein